MENLTSCQEHFIKLKKMMIESNLTMKFLSYPGYPGEEPAIWNSPDVSGYIKIFSYVIIIIGGLLGNLSVILTVALIKSMRNTINFYVTNLAVADAAICIICMLPHTLTVYTGDNFILGEFMCKFNPFTQTTCLTSSVLTLCAISCDRFVAVFRPLEVRTTEKRTSVILAAIWIISMGVSIPLLIVKKYYVLEWLDFMQPSCSEEWPIFYHRNQETLECEREYYLRQIYYVVVSISLFFVPIVIMLTAYLMILHKLCTSSIPGEHSEANSQVQSRSRNRVLKMVFIVLVVFIICWTPLQVTILISAFGYETDSRLLPTWYTEFKWFSYFIAYANSFLNPFIYGQYNKDFRDGFCLILHCGHRRRRSGSQGPSIIVKSVRSMSTTLSSLKRGTQAFIDRRLSKPNDIEMKPTSV